MAHLEHHANCRRVKARFPNFFKGVRVLDAGSLDVNGNNRYLFENCFYTGIDVGEGKNVDQVSLIHEYHAPDGYFDTIISTNCFEHDMYFELSIKNIARMLRKGGLFVVGCATDKTNEHGTVQSDTYSSPLTSMIEGWENFYQNRSIEDFWNVFGGRLKFCDVFPEHAFEIGRQRKDLYFWGLKG
jgi:SAM-dependent methyltransferase